MPIYDDAARAVDELLKRLSSSSATPVLPAPNRWWLDPSGNPGPQSVLEKAIAAEGLDRNAMTSGAFINPRTGQVLDGRVYGAGSVLVDPRTGRPMMAVDGEMPSDTLKKCGPLERSLILTLCEEALAGLRKVMRWTCLSWQRLNLVENISTPEA